MASSSASAASPLHTFNPIFDVNGVSMEEVALMSHLVLRGNPDNADFAGGVKKALGVALPGRLQSAENGERVIRWISPDEWLVTAPASDGKTLEAALRDGISAHFSVVDVSGGQTLVNVSGGNAEEMLRKCTTYDIHPRNFPIGKVVTSTLAKSQAVIRRTGDEAFELVIRRSFADYCWKWMMDAAKHW